MQKILYPANTRGKADYGWLQANYSFSFANFFDPNRIQFGKLRVLNDDFIAPAMGFSTHPHENMEIITIPQAGALRHRDSMGNEGVITAGDIQVMSAGTGVEHSEHNASTTEPLKLFQIWVLPEEQNISPRYDQKEIAPLLRPNAFSTVVKPKDKASASELWINQQSYFSIGDFSEDTETSYSLNRNSHGLYVFVISGRINVDGEVLNERDAMGILGASEVSFNVQKDSRILLIEVPMN